MDIFETIFKRRSVRIYEQREIEREKLDRILEAARMAPTSFNSQNFKLVVVKDQKAKANLASLSKSPFIAKAPLILGALNVNIENKYAPLDIAVVLDHIMLSAWDLGIGTVFIGAYQNDEIRKVLGAPETAEAVALMALGYPADREIPKRRKSLDELVSYEKF